MRILFIALLLLSSFAYADDAPTALTLTTDAFMDGGPIPVLYTCDGKDESFLLRWSNVPNKAKSLALIIEDPTTDSGVFYHWVVYNMPTTVTSLPINTTKAPAGAKFGKNSFNHEIYNGPCPPQGTNHTYLITLYALDKTLNVPNHSGGVDVENALGSHVVGKAQISGVYSRWPK